MDVSLIGQGFSLADLNNMDTMEYQIYFDIIKERKEKEDAEYEKMNSENK